jgi:hypothetical protein
LEKKFFYYIKIKIEQAKLHNFLKMFPINSGKKKNFSIFTPSLNFPSKNNKSTKKDPKILPLQKFLTKTYAPLRLLSSKYSPKANDTS